MMDIFFWTFVLEGWNGRPWWIPVCVQRLLQSTRVTRGIESNRGKRVILRLSLRRKPALVFWVLGAIPKMVKQIDSGKMRFFFHHWMMGVRRFVQPLGLALKVFYEKGKQWQSIGDPWVGPECPSWMAGRNQWVFLQIFRSKWWIL